MFMEDNTSEADIQKMTAYLKAQPYTKTATFKSKEEAIISTCELIGEDPNEFVDYNPLPDMFEVYLQAQYANNDSILFVAQQLTNMEYVKKVDYQKTIIQSIGSKINRVTLLLLGATLLLLVISYVLIRNTIQLLVYSDRFMIHTMKLVGATGHFIRKPYMKQGLYIALVAFVLVVIYIYMLNHIFKEELPFDIFNMQDPSVWVLFAVLLACSIVITSVAEEPYVFTLKKLMLLDGRHPFTMLIGYFNFNNLNALLFGVIKFRLFCFVRHIYFHPQLAALFCFKKDIRFPSPTISD